MNKLYTLSVALLMCTSLNAQNLVYRTHFSNGQAQDVSGNNYHGVLSGSPAAAVGYSGVTNSAMRFDGIDDKVILPAVPAFNLTKWTLQALVKPEAFYAGQCQVSTILWHGLLYSNEHYSLRICDNWYDNDCGTNTTMDAFDTEPAGNSSMDFHSNYYNNGYATANQWYCLTGTYDGDSIKLYVDGSLIVSGAWADQYNYTGTQSCYIGWSPHVNFPYWFTGIMDEVSIWDDVVTFTAQNPGLCDTFDAASVKPISNDKGDVKVYPSPATDEVTVELSQAWKGGDIVIMNGIGQIVIHEKAVPSKNTINIKTLPVGIYILKVVKGGVGISEKFIKN